VNNLLIALKKLKLKARVQLQEKKQLADYSASCFHEG
jgi:hypothetical protein